MYTAPLDEKKGSKLAVQQTVVTRLGGALGVVPTFKAPEHAASEQTVAATRVADSYGLGRESSQAVLAALNAADGALSLCTAETDRIVEIRQLATSPVVQGLPGWGTKLGLAEQFHQRMVDTAAQVDGPRLALIEKFTAATAKPQKKAKGGALRERLKEQAEMNAAFDRAVLVAVDEELKLVNKLSEDVGGLVRLLRRTAAEWRQAIEDHQRIEDAKSRVGIAQTQFTTFMTNEAAVATGLGFDLADLGRRQAEMQGDADKGSWLDAGRVGVLLVKDLNDLRGEIASAIKLKSNYQDKLVETYGALKQLETRLSAARVKDASILGGVETCLNDAKELGRKDEWRAATKALARFWKAYGQAETVVEQFAYYADGAVPRLLAGTIDAVSAGHGDVPAAVLAALNDAYELQCEVLRDDWLTFLAIAGDNVKVGSDGDHYTTFNNSVPVGTNVSVYGKTPNPAGVSAVCNALFEVAPSLTRIHATFVNGADRYHRYWNDGLNGPAVYAANGPGPRQDRLDARYTQMVTDMRAKVLTVIQQHGRIGRHLHGPTV